MALRDKLRRLEKTMRGNLDYIELADGTHYYFEPEKIWSELFMHGSNCLRADYESEPRPEPPAILQAVANAKDRRSVGERIYPPGATPFTAYETEALIERGEFVPRSFLAGHNYAESREYFGRKNAEKE
jgi:hypothetical protein